MNSSISFSRVLAAALAITAVGAQAQTSTATVSGNDNPFLAGQPNGTICCGNDTSPAQSPTLALTGFVTGQPITFSGTGGFNYDGGTPYSTLDGNPGYIFNMEPRYESFAISGALQIPVSSLVGVFLTNALPNGSAPSQRNDGTSFTILSPSLGQIFFIGDGLTGTGAGTVQQFFAPAGATRLYLGSADGFGWQNNTGTADVTINYVSTVSAAPEPATWAMMIGGFGIAGVALRRRKAQARVAHA